MNGAWDGEQNEVLAGILKNLNREDIGKTFGEAQVRTFHRGTLEEEPRGRLG